jgi:RNA polymerase sigma-70 factor, ECF subfamily
VPNSTDTATKKTLEEFCAYLETLACIQIDPRLRSRVSPSDIVQNTLMEALPDLERLRALDDADRKRLLRRMYVNNLLQEIERHLAGRRDARLERSLEGAAEESVCRLRDWLAVEDSSPRDRLMRQEEALRLLEALANLDPRQREAIILQKYHRWTLAQIAEHLNCTAGAVAGLHARGLKKLRQYLPDME